MFRPVLLLFALCTPSLPGQSLVDTASKIIEATHKAGDFDGVVVLSRNGKVVLAEALGDADRSVQLPNRPETVFRLASLTKQVTALLVMQEVSAGHVRLEQPAGELIKSLPPASATVTVRQLLQHVTGLPNPSDGPDNVIPGFYTRVGPDAADMQKTASGFCSSSTKRPAGTSFEYNNCDYILLGAILEVVTGRSYAELLRARVIEPLGLASWGYFPADPKLAARVAVGYQQDGTVEDFQNVATYAAAGAIYGNALDVAKWDNALLTNQLLSADATATMFQASPKLYGEALGSWSYDLPGSSPTLHLVERQGDVGGTHVLNLLLPKLDASIVILANTERADLFNTYSKKGLGYQLATACNTFNK